MIKLKLPNNYKETSQYTSLQLDESFLPFLAPSFGFMAHHISRQPGFQQQQAAVFSKKNKALVNTQYTTCPTPNSRQSYKLAGEHKKLLL